MNTKTSIVSKTKVGKFFTYKIGDRIVKAKSKVDYQFCCICQIKENVGHTLGYSKDYDFEKNWGQLGFSNNKIEINKICDKFKTWTTIYKNVQVVEIIEA